VVERDLSCCGNCPLQAPQRRRSRSLVGGELRETNPCFFVWFASLSSFSSIFELLPLRSTWVCYLCLQGSLPYLWSSTKATHQVWFVLEVKRSLKLFLQVLCATPVWPLRCTGLTGASCEVQCLTGLTGHHHQSDRWTLTAQVFREEKYNLVVSPIHSPLGDIKILSTSSGLMYLCYGVVLLLLSKALALLKLQKMEWSLPEVLNSVTEWQSKECWCKPCKARWYAICLSHLWLKIFY
jgi:hypothetical protein